MTKAFWMQIADIQPSQMFISTAKLSAVQRWFDPAHVASYEPIPVKRLDDRTIFTDGHTRAFAAHRHGLTRILVYQDQDKLDWEAYAICVEWCRDNAIYCIADLENRVIAPEVYAVQWHARCDALHRRLAAQRAEQT